MQVANLLADLPDRELVIILQIALDHVMSYLVQLRKHHEEMAKQCADELMQSSRATCSVADNRSSYQLTDGTLESVMSKVVETQLANGSYAHKSTDSSSNW